MILYICDIYANYLVSLLVNSDVTWPGLTFVMSLALMTQHDLPDTKEGGF